MINPIPGGTAFDFGAAAQVPATQTQSTTSVASVKQPAGVEPVADTVELSPVAQVRLLRAQGQTIAEIAINTASSVETVNNYLAISPEMRSIPTGKK